MVTSSAARSRSAALLMPGRCARSTSMSCVLTGNTGFSAFIALCSTTAIWDQRSLRSCSSSAVSRSTVCPGSGW